MVVWDVLGKRTAEDGWAVGRLIRGQGGHRVLLFAVTSCGREQDRAGSREAGFDGHLLKPDYQEELEGLLTRAAGRPGDGPIPGPPHRQKEPSLAPRQLTM